MIKSVRLTNFFSFRDCEITLEPDVTVLVGINGSGKTNLLRAFELLKAGMEGRLREKILNWGGYETIYCRNKLYDDFEGVLGLKFLLDANQLGQFGYPYLEDITCSLSLMRLQSPEDYLLSTRLTVNPDGRKETLLDISGESGYAFEQIDYEKQDRSEEEYRMPVKNAEGTSVKIKGQSFHESALASFNDLSRFPAQTASARGLRNQASYSDFDTRPRSQMRQSIQATGLDVLDSDGANLFQILNTIQLKSTEAGDAIEKDLREVNPQFDRLQFQPLGQGGMLTYLREIGLKTPIPAAHVSDGTLRYLCLLAIAHNPDRGRLICLDEPERGLHPDMLAGVARLLLDDGHATPEAPRHTSYVVATHSPQLLSRFPLRCLRIFEKDENNQTVVRQFGDDEIARFREWYETFDAGSLWLKGELGGTRW